jgi:hypothetical protein
VMVMRLVGRLSSFDAAGEGAERAAAVLCGDCVYLLTAAMERSTPRVNRCGDIQVM